MRNANRKYGSVTLTEMELRKKQPTSVPSSGTAAGAPLTKFTKDFAPGDWTASGGSYYIDCIHGKRTRNIIVQVVQKDTSNAVFPDTINTAPDGNTDKCRIWHAQNLSVTVTII